MPLIILIITQLFLLISPTVQCALAFGFYVYLICFQVNCCSLCLLRVFPFLLPSFSSFTLCPLCSLPADASMCCVVYFWFSTLLDWFFFRFWFFISSSCLSNVSLSFGQMQRTALRCVSFIISWKCVEERERYREREIKRETEIGRTGILILIKVSLKSFKLCTPIESSSAQDLYLSIFCRRLWTFLSLSHAHSSILFWLSSFFSFCSLVW